VLVTHDRYLLDRVSTVVLGLDGSGKAERFADYSQWAADQTSRKPAKPKPATSKPATPEPAKKKLSYLERREYDSIEQRIQEMEAAILKKNRAMEAAAAKGSRDLAAMHLEIEAAQREVDSLYARWAELEEKVR
jgi:ATP-binding cassette subfamily F protein uup